MTGETTMSETFLGQVLMAGFAFAPRGFAQCNGQFLPISQNQALFALLGTQFGGDGRVTFALPDLRGRTPIGFASSVDPSWQPPPMQIGERAGTEAVTLTSANLPNHGHAVAGTTLDGTTRNPNNAIFARTGESLYGPATGNLVPLASNSVSPAGGNQPHANMQPYAVINFCIALTGIFPSRN